MSDAEIVRIAELLATHAVPLLTVALLAAVVSVAGIVLAVRLVARFRRSILGGFLALLQRGRSHEALNRLLVRGRQIVPSAYVALHLLLGLAGTAAVTSFIALAEEVVGHGDAAVFDAAFARALRAGRRPEWERFFAIVSWFGSQQVLALGTLVIATALLFGRRPIVAFAWTAAQAGGGLLNLTLKETFERTRPEFTDPLLASSSWSFPSGHAMGTFIFCALGCYLLSRDRRSWATTAIAVSLTVSWCLLMAFSRLYLGVHYPTDVLAGLLAGGAWAAVCISALEVIRR